MTTMFAILFVLTGIGWLRYQQFFSEVRRHWSEFIFASAMPTGSHA